MRDGRSEIVLVHRLHPPLWALPKGTPDAGETLAETALRETREETGLDVDVEEELGEIRYFFVRGTTRFNKTVHFFLMRATGGSTDAHDHEFDEVRWFPLDEALALMTHRTEREVVDRARDRLEARARAPEREAAS